MLLRIGFTIILHWMFSMWRHFWTLAFSWCSSAASVSEDSGIVFSESSPNHFRCDIKTNFINRLSKNSCMSKSQPFLVFSSDKLKYVGIQATNHRKLPLKSNSLRHPYCSTSRSFVMNVKKIFIYFSHFSKSIYMELGVQLVFLCNIGAYE